MAKIDNSHLRSILPKVIPDIPGIRASTIIQDGNHRLVTDAEKTQWNEGGGVLLGETHDRAYYGDKGKSAYDHSQDIHAPTDAQKNSDITKSEIEVKLTGEVTSHTHPGGGGGLTQQQIEGLL